MISFLLQGASEQVVAAAETTGGNIINQALLITGVGMGILFASLLILWGVMELLVRLVKDAPEKEVEETIEPAAYTLSDEELKARAAAAAVASIQDYDLKMKAAAAAVGFVSNSK